MTEPRASTNGGWWTVTSVGGLTAPALVSMLTLSRESAKTNARRAHLTALRQPERERSVEGVLKFAQAFPSLGDAEPAASYLQIADTLAAGQRRR